MDWPTEEDVTDLAGSAGITIPTQANVEAEISAVVAYSLRSLRRSYTPLTEARAFDGGGREFLALPGFTALTLVEFLAPDGSVDETADPNSYRRYPENAAFGTALRRTTVSGLYVGDPVLVYSGDVPPDVTLKGRFRRAVWPLGAQNVRVTATWADAAGIPDDLAVAARKLVLLRLMGAVVGDLTDGLTAWEEAGVSKETFTSLPYAQTLRLWAAEVKEAYAGNRRKLLLGRR